MAKGRKTGGRQKGSRNKYSREAEIAASGLTPLEYLLSIMRGDGKPLERLEAARAAAPYVHPKLASVELSGKNGQPLEVRVVRFSDRTAESVGTAALSDARLESIGTGNAPRSPVLAPKERQG